MLAVGEIRLHYADQTMCVRFKLLEFSVDF